MIGVPGITLVRSIAANKRFKAPLAGIVTPNSVTYFANVNFEPQGPQLGIQRSFGLFPFDRRAHGAWYPALRRQHHQSHIRKTRRRSCGKSLQLPARPHVVSGLQVGSTLQRAARGQHPARGVRLKYSW